MPMLAPQKIYGNFLAPARNITADHRIVLGRLSGGGNGAEVSIHSGSEISIPNGPPPVIPEPTTMLFGVGLVAFTGLSRRRSL
jgi:hypothetical protein